MKKFRTFILAAVLCALPLSALADPIRIGLMCPLTGGWASEGQDMRQIITLLADEVNAAGGINGDSIELFIEDDGGDPRTAAMAAQKLASNDVIAVIGTYGSAVTEASQNIYDESGILQIGTGSTSVRLTEKGMPYFFRTCPRDDEQGLVAARNIQELGFKSVAILHDNSSYARGLADETRAHLDAAGIEVVFFDALTPGERDFSPILTRLQSAEPDFIFFTGYYPEAGLLLRQKMEMGWNVPMMGGDAVNNPDLVEIAGKTAAEGFMFISPPVPGDLSTPEGLAFLQAFQTRYEVMPQSVWAVLAGDAFNVLVDALRNVDPNAEAIADYFKTGMNEYSGITGSFSFDEKGDRIGDLYQLYQVNGDGAFQVKE